MTSSPIPSNAMNRVTRSYSSTTPAGPLLFILSGPSGVGKDAVLARLKSSDSSLKFITTMTTRPRREKEREGIDYRFITVEQFKELQARNELLESASVYGNWYGVPKDAVRQALADGYDVMLKVDIQGVANIKKIVPQAVAIFLSPESIQDLKNRLRRRHTESAADLDKRLKIATDEMKEATKFDYVVLNREREIERAAAEIKEIIAVEKRRPEPRIEIVL